MWAVAHQRESHEAWWQIKFPLVDVVRKLGHSRSSRFKAIGALLYLAFTLPRVVVFVGISYQSQCETRGILAYFITLGSKLINQQKSYTREDLI